VPFSAVAQMTLVIINDFIALRGWMGALTVKPQRKTSFVAVVLIRIHPNSGVRKKGQVKLGSNVLQSTCSAAERQGGMHFSVLSSLVVRKVYVIQISLIYVAVIRCSVHQGILPARMYMAAIKKSAAVPEKIQMYHLILCVEQVDKVLSIVYHLRLRNSPVVHLGLALQKILRGTIVPTAVLIAVVLTRRLSARAKMHSDVRVSTPA
jgi:hypothetical protein